MKFLFAFTLAASVAALVIAVPVGPKAEDGGMAELENLAALTALLSKQPASDSDTQIAVQENTQTKETGEPLTQVFHGGYTFFRVPFKSSTSSNADILATCKAAGLMAPCDWIYNGYPACGGCTEVPIEAHASQQGPGHFGHGGYESNTYSWPGGRSGWRSFFMTPSSLHIFANNVNEGCQKSTRAADSHDWMYQGSSHGFCLCAIKGKARADTSDYQNKHAAEAVPILDMLDQIRIKISTKAAKDIKELDSAKTALKAAEKTYEEATASVNVATKLTSQQASVDQRELDMLNKIVEMVHTLNGRGCDSNEKGESCAEILKKCPNIASGVYTIAPASQSAQKLFCDMKTDGGGWTLIMKTDKSSANDRTTGETNVDALQNADLNAVAKVSDAFGNAVGKEFRITAAGVKSMFIKSQGLPIFRTTDAAQIAGQWNKPVDQEVPGLAYFRYSTSDSWANGHARLHNAHAPCFNVDGNWGNLHFCFGRWCCGGAQNGFWVNGGGVSGGMYAGTVFVR